MEKAYYLFKFTKKGETQSLGIMNERRMVEEMELPSIYYRLTREARKFAGNNSLKIDVIPETIFQPSEAKDISEYIFGHSRVNAERFRRHLNWLTGKGRIPTFQIRVRTHVPIDELVGREVILSRISQKISRNNISLRAPRCYGKTAILNAISEKHPPGFNAFFVQTRNLLTPESFVGEIAYELKKGEPSEREKAREKYEASAAKDWLKTSRSLFKKNKSYLILIDEFAEFLRNLKEAIKIEDFINSFSKLFKEKNIRIIVASSESEERNIGKVLYKKLFSNFETIEVPLLKDKDAKLLLEELAYNSRIIPKQEDVDSICRLIKDHVPYFIHIFVGVWKEKHNLDNAVTPHEVYEELIGKTGWNLLRDFQELPKRYPGKDALVAKAILSQVADKGKITKEISQKIYKEKKGELNIEHHEELIDRLKDDLLIGEDASKKKGIVYSFKSKLLRDFWRRYPTK